MQTHEVKSWPEFYVGIESGDKPFDLRFDDRRYALNDLIQFREYVPGGGLIATEGYTGRECTKRITWILAGIGNVGVIAPLKGLNRGYVILGLAPPKRNCHRGVGDPPQDCGWPHCGCDEAANRVLANLDEGGWVIARRQVLETAIEAVEVLKVNL